MINIFSNGYKVEEQCIKEIISKVFTEHGVEGDYEVNVNFVSRDEIKKLHDKKDHDVLSFPLEAEKGPDGTVRYGEIVIVGDLPVHKRDELVAHSCLHLLGIHHE